MLSFEIAESGKVIRIYIDRDGLSILQTALNDLKTDGDHVHLLSRPNGGSQLDELTPWGTPAVQEVIMTTGGDDPLARCQ